MTRHNGKHAAPMAPAANEAQDITTGPEDAPSTLGEPAGIHSAMGLVLAPGDVALRDGGVGLLIARGNLAMTDGGAGMVLAGGDVALNDGGAGLVLARGDVRLRNGGAAAFAAGRDLQLQNGGAGLLLAGRDLTLTRGAAAGPQTTALVAAPQAHLDGQFVGLVVAGQVDLTNSRVLLALPLRPALDAVVDLGLGLLDRALAWLAGDGR